PSTRRSTASPLRAKRTFRIVAGTTIASSILLILPGKRKGAGRGTRRTCSVEEVPDEVNPPRRTPWRLDTGWSGIFGRVDSLPCRRSGLSCPPCPDDRWCLWGRRRRSRVGRGRCHRGDVRSPQGHRPRVREPALPGGGHRSSAGRWPAFGISAPALF